MKMKSQKSGETGSQPKSTMLLVPKIDLHYTTKTWRNSQARFYQNQIFLA